MDNRTDIILTQPTPFGDTARKVELDDQPDKAAQFRLGAMDILMFPSNPITLGLDAVCWVCASSVMLLVASVWLPVVLIWGLWCLTLVVLVWLPTSALGGTVKVCAMFRLALMLLGAVALIL